MTEKKTGGPAFPTGTGWNHEGNWVGGGDDGMTLRDYFAAKAMVGLLAANPDTISELIKATKGSGSVSELAYYMANAMLKAREE